MTFAHVKWFTETSAELYEHPLRVHEFLLIVISVALLIKLAHAVNRHIIEAGAYQKIDMKLKQLTPYVPQIVRYTTAALLLLNSSRQYLLAPNVIFDGSFASVIALGSFSLAGLMLLVGGLFIRPAALIMIVGYLSVLFGIDASAAFDHVEYLGLIGYLLLAGETGSIVKGLERARSRFDAYSMRASDVLRVFAGVDLVILAFSEKLFNIGLAERFLSVNDWNMLANLGVSDRGFVLFAGTIELFIGVSLIANIAARLSTLLLLSTMSLTAMLLGVDEVIGHLFAIAVVAVVWIPSCSAIKSKQRKK